MGNIEIKYYIYKTTNLINGKIYVGLHKSKNIDKDKYIGTGWAFVDAVNKYGRENFVREILFEFATLEEANAKENEIVNEEFIERDDNYNLRTGGNVGSVSEETRKRMSESLLNSEKFQTMIRSESRRKKLSEIFSGRECPWVVEINKNPEKIRKTAEKHRGSKRTEEQCKNISESIKGKQTGRDNALFSGYYMTPFGKFDSLESASKAIGNSKICIRDRCKIKNENTVKMFSKLTDPKITDEMIGKTWKELGWGFEPAQSQSRRNKNV